jgi:GAF domain-containing protein
VNAAGEPAGGEAVPRQYAHLERLQRLTEALSQAATLGDVIRVVLERALAFVDGGAFLVFWERRPGELELVHGLGLSDEHASRYRRISAGEPLPCAEALRTGEPVWLRSQAEIAKRFPALVPLARRERVEAWAAIPVALGASRGAIGLQFRESRRFDDDERAFLLAAVRQCAFAVERARVFDAHRRLADRLQHLQLTAATLSAAATPRDVATAAFRALGAVGACAAEIHALAGPERLVLVARHGRPSGEDGGHVPLEAPLPAAEVVRTGRALWLDAPEIAARYPHLEAGRAEREEGAWAVVPLLASGRALGALSVAFRSARRLEADERTFVRLVAQPCAAALERAQLFEDAKRSRAEAEWAAAVLAAGLAAAPLAIALVDREGRFILASESFARAVGGSAEVRVGRTPNQVFPGVVGAQLEAAIGEVLASGAPVDRAVVGEAPAATGATRRLSTRLYPVRVDGALVGVGVVLGETT